MSTRRARIKAVTALPPRRRNVDSSESKKKAEETEERSQTTDKVPEKNKEQNDIPPQKRKDGFEAEASPSKRRLSQDKKEKVEDVIKKTPIVRRLSIQKTPKPRTSVDGSPNTRRKSIAKTPDYITFEVPQIGNESTADGQVRPNSPKKVENAAKPDENKVPDTNILKSLLDATRKPPNFNKSFRNEIPHSKDSEMGRPSVPIFASPLARASPRRPSPIVRTPVIEVDLTAEKFIAPHKGPNSVKTSYRKDIEVEKVAMKAYENLKEFTKSSETDVMDGIIPLQQASKAPKPLDLLKNEIISENAEVLFDPIVPLPSPSKVRPKLRPVPRLGPRRNSFQQGSASESEDENRRLLGRPATPATPGPGRQRHDSHSTNTSMLPRDVARVRNDSVCSSVSQAPSHAVGSPLREREKPHKSRREEMSARRAAGMRRRQAQVERDKLTMYDLIFYNPKSNPIIPDQDEIKAKEASKKEDEERKVKAQKKEEPETDGAPAAVPQIKLGPNGEIILDEQSLVVNQSDHSKLDTSIVREGAWGGAGSRAYRRTPRTADWSDAETVRFYRAIAAMGTDFTLMQPLFPTRTRRDLKLKFKKEERVNLPQVEMALRSGSEWNPERLETEFTEERSAAEEAAARAKEQLLREKEEERERAREMRGRRSRGARTLGLSVMPARPPASLDEYVKLQQERKRISNQQKRAKRNKSPQIRPPPPPGPAYATLTPIDKTSNLRPHPPKKPNDMAIISRETVPNVPKNIEAGSLVVLTVNDPQSPSRKMLQTYIAQGPGNLTPVSLPANFLNSVVGFMKKTGSPKAGPPSGIETTTNIISPRKRKSSYTITQL